MGWWSTGNGNDLVGDGPADTIQAMLANIAASCFDEGKPKPTPMQFLTAMMKVINENAEVVIHGGAKVHIRKLEVQFEPHLHCASTGEVSSAIQSLEEPLDHAFVAIAREYEDVLGRKPRITELLSTVQFVLGHEPSIYLSVDAEVTKVKITAEHGPISRPRQREALMKEDLLDKYVQFYIDRIAQYESDIHDSASSASDRALLRDVITQNKLYLFIARYSRGDDLGELRRTFPSLIEALAACESEDVLAPVNFAYLEGYVRALWLVSLATLFEVEDVLLERLLNLIGQSGIDGLYDRLVMLRFPKQGTTSTLLYSVPYLPLYQALDAEAAKRDIYIHQFLEQFYRGMQDTHWYDIHLRREREFFGYWSFTLAAFVKGLNIPDASFADNYFYPRDLTGHRLFRTWDDSELGEGDHQALRKLREEL